MFEILHFVPDDKKKGFFNTLIELAAASVTPVLSSPIFCLSTKY
jgi:hypothetical protein